MFKKFSLLVSWIMTYTVLHAQPTLVTTQGPIMPVYQLSFSASGRLFLTLSGERAMMIWDSNSGKPVHAFYPEMDIEAAAFRPDEKSIATLSYDDTVRLWDLEKRKLTWKVPLQMGSQGRVEFSPDGAQLAISVSGGKVNILDANTGKQLRELTAFTHGENEVTAALVKFSPDGKYLITSAMSYPAKVWDAKKGTLLYTTASEELDNTGIVVSTDSKYFATQSLNSTVWELSSGKRVMTTGCESIDFIKGTNKLVSSGDKKALLWEIGKKTPDTLRGFYPILAQSRVVASPGGTYIALGEEEGIVNVVLVGYPDKLLNPKDLTHLKTFSFHPSGQRLYGFCEDQLSITSLATFKETAIKFGAVPRVQFRMDGKAINIYFEDEYGEPNHHEVIWDLTEGAILTDEEDVMVFDSRIYRTAGNRKASVNQEGTDITVVDNAGKSLVLKNSGSSFTFNQEGTYLISKWPARFTEGSITYLFEPTFIWRTNDGALIKNGVFSSTEFNRDGSRFITTNADGKITLHETATGKEMISVSFLGPTEWVVTHPSGLFDASPDAIRKLYFSEGTRIVTDGNLFEKYREPGLWKKVMSGRTLRVP